MNPPLDSVFNALADPTRRAIISRLTRGDATVGELAEPFSISAPAISRHLKVLEQAQLIRRTTEAQKRRLSLNPAALESVANWIETQRTFWESSLDRLEVFLEQESKEPTT